ncbi:ParB/RepB/Spo0J family partition protein [Patescibacteria group bacterium]
MVKAGLGKGLEALIPKKVDLNVKKIGGGVEEVSVEKIKPNPNQPRKEFNEVELKELADSIKEHGVLQPLVVAPDKAQMGEYFIIVGERRWRAAKLAGLKAVPVIIREVDQQKNLELAIVENIQRTDLNPLEEAQGYAQLRDEFNLTQAQIADKVGKQRTTVANILRLLDLPVAAQKALAAGKITAGHAKIILGQSDTNKQLELLDAILKKKLTVRDSEALLRSTQVKAHTRRQNYTDPESTKMAQQLSDRLGAKVKLKRSTTGGQLIITWDDIAAGKKILDTLLSQQRDFE